MGSTVKDVQAHQKPESEASILVSESEVRDIDGDSSESDGETEPARSFHRRISTNKEIKCAVSRSLNV